MIQLAAEIKGKCNPSKGNARKLLNEFLSDIAFNKEDLKKCYISPTYAYNRCVDVSWGLAEWLTKMGCKAFEINMHTPKFGTYKGGMHDIEKNRDDIGHTVVVLEDKTVIDATAAQFGYKYRKCCTITDIDTLHENWDYVDVWQVF